MKSVRNSISMKIYFGISLRSTVVLAALSLLGLLSPTTTATAQQQDAIPTLLVRATRTDAGIQLNWFPTDPETWRAQLTRGYTVTRRELDAAGQPTGATVTVARGVLPRDTAWFAANERTMDGRLVPIGMLLYDSTFVFPPNDILDETEMKFNFIVAETRFEPLFAEAAGLGLLDATAVAERGYRYRVQLEGESLGIDLDLPATIGFARNPDDYVHRFTFPDGKSLSDMYYEATPDLEEGVRVIHRAYGDSIVLRWGPTSATLWDRTNQLGYQVYRSLRDGPLELVGSVRPWTEDMITPETTQGDTVAMMAASLLLNREEPTDNFDDQRMQFENRYGFALYLAERSPLAADILGLRFVDREVQRDSGYTYFVGSLALRSMTDWGNTVVFNTPPPVIGPAGFRAETRDGAIYLRWDKENEQQFSAYRLERGVDTTNFVQLNSAPLVFAEDARLPLSEFSFVDSVGNGRQFYYRLQGLNSFGEWSGEARAYGMARDLTPPPPPSIIAGTYNDTTRTFFIEWMDDPDMTDRQRGDLANYQVVMSDNLEENYAAVSEYLPGLASDYSFGVSDLQLGNAAYFKIGAIDANGNRSESQAYMINIPDIVAPDPPEEVTGIIDSNGVVQIAWTHSPSEDTRGYWVYWSNDTTQEFSLLNETILEINAYTYAIEDTSLNEEIYYLVRAEDNAYNRGYYSDLLTLQRPDKVEPMPIYLGAIEPDEDALVINWIPSVSDDVVRQSLYRRSLTNSDWILLDAFPPDQQQYRDTDVVIGERYAYSLISVDDADNYSARSNDREGSLPFPAEAVVVTDLKVAATTYREQRANALSWNYEPLNADIGSHTHRFVIYRSSGGGPLRKLKELSGGQFSYTDIDVEDSVLYNYAIQVHFTNGWRGGMSPVKSILVK
jgi:hypothetical protein